MPAPSIFCLHFLGGSAGTWDAVAARLAPGLACAALDLPGFGKAAGDAGASVSGMAERVVASIRQSACDTWWIAGHSMGAKVALAVARRAEDGVAGLAGFAGIALLAGSPPSPEPMSEDKRADLIAWIDANEDVRREKARTYIADNVGSPLAASLERRAVEDVLRANPLAWTRWLTSGAREDWRAEIGVLQAPALIVGGTKDDALGPSAQARLMVPHLAEPRVVALEGAGHLLPLEQPDAIASLLNEAIGPV